MRRMSTLPVALGVTAFFVTWSFAAAAGDARQQVVTAAAHAGMAAGASDVKMVKAHLQHVINCLVGPSGEGYDSTQANPCKEMGFGAVPDASMDKIPALQAAVKLAREGEAAPGIETAREKALATQAALDKLAK